MEDSNQAVNSAASTSTTAITTSTIDAGSTITEKEDPTAIIYALAMICYLLFVVISASMKVINNKLLAFQADLEQGVKIQGFMQQSDATKKDDTVELGGSDADHKATERANQILDYLRSIGSDNGQKLPANRKISAAIFANFNIAINSHIDLTKQQAQTETAKADSVQKAANAALDIATSILKAHNSSSLTVAQSTPR
jgi:hypothetical protein